MSDNTRPPLVCRCSDEEAKKADVLVDEVLEHIFAPEEPPPAQFVDVPTVVTYALDQHEERSIFEYTVVWDQWLVVRGVRTDGQAFRATADTLGDALCAVYKAVVMTE